MACCCCVHAECPHFLIGTPTHADCASVYANEHEVGDALEEIFSEGVLARSELFVTSKLW